MGSIKPLKNCSAGLSWFHVKLCSGYVNTEPKNQSISGGIKMNEIADTLANILENPVVEVALDKKREIEEVLGEVSDAWKVDLNNRNPAPAYKETIEGVVVYQGTDLDMFTFMNALADREAVINIPEYERIAPKSVKSNQRLISDKDRHGSVMGVIANKDIHSFNVRINDYQVVETKSDGKEIVGAPRNFALVEYTGEWNDGWKVIEFKPDAKENEFLEKHDIWAENTIVFENFIHPNLANAFYGSRYLETKALGMRVKDEASHYRKIAKELRNQGIRLGEDVPYEKKPFATTDKRNTESVKIENLEAKLILPNFSGEYPIKGMSGDGEIKEYKQMPANTADKQNVLRFAESRAKELSYTVGPKLTAPTRAVELAYFKHGFVGEREPGNERNPGWNIPEWERGYKTTPKSRTQWNALKLNDSTVLAYRIRETSVQRAV